MYSRKPVHAFSIVRGQFLDLWDCLLHYRRRRTTSELCLFVESDQSTVRSPWLKDLELFPPVIARFCRWRKTCRFFVRIPDSCYNWRTYSFDVPKREMFRLLKAFFASMNRMPWVSGFSNCFLRLCIAMYSAIPHFWPRRSCLVLRKSFRSFSTQRSMLLPMIPLRTSPTPIGRTPKFLARGIRR